MSVKDGCSEGACGTCSVIVDGKLVKACVQKVSRFDGCSVTTSGGSFSEREGSLRLRVRRGRSSTVRLLHTRHGDRYQSTTRQKPGSYARRDPKSRSSGISVDARDTRRLFKAIELAARLLRTGEPVEALPDKASLSDRSHRIDVAEKVLGTGKVSRRLPIRRYDLRSGATSRNIRVSASTASISRKRWNIPIASLYWTADDVPENKIGHIVQDWDVMIREGDVTRFVGDAIALVATNKRESLQEVLGCVSQKRYIEER